MCSEPAKREVHLFCVVRYSDLKCSSTVKPCNQSVSKSAPYLCQGTCPYHLEDLYLNSLTWLLLLVLSGSSVGSKIHPSAQIIQKLCFYQHSFQQQIISEVETRLELVQISANTVINQNKTLCHNVTMVYKKNHSTFYIPLSIFLQPTVVRALLNDSSTQFSLFRRVKFEQCVGLIGEPHLRFFFWGTGTLKLTEVLKSVTVASVFRSHTNPCLNELSFQTHVRNTRQATKALFFVSNYRLTFCRNTIQYRGSVMYNEISIEKLQASNEFI